MADSKPKRPRLRVVITGASSGLGRALALAFAKKKAAIVLAARRKEELESVAAECRKLGGDPHVCIADVGTEEGCKAVAAAAQHHVPSGIDYLVLNAGIGMRGTVAEIKDTDIYRKLLSVNTLGYVYTTHYCMPLVQKAGGRLIVVSSVSGLFGLPNLAGYCMSKAALHGFFDALRNEGTGVTMVCPGFMATEMPSKNMGVDGRPVGANETLERGHAWSPDYVAERTIDAAATGQRDLVFDLPIRIALKLRHVCPSLLDALIQRRFQPKAKL